MPTSRRAALDLFNFDGVLSLDLDAGVAVIDLTRVTFVDAYALTGLACSVASANVDGLPVRLLLPERYDVRSWLSRMHLGDVLDAFQVRVEGSLPKIAERDRRDNLIELERFQDSRGIDRLASFIWERLQGGGADGEVVNQLYEATGELGLNVVEHAGSPSGGFVAAQRYKAGTPEEWIIVAVGGRGDGHPRVAPGPVRRHDRGRGDPAGDPVVRVPRSRPGPGPGPPRGRRRGQGPWRHRLHQERGRVPDHYRKPGEIPRCVQPSRYDCRCSGALPAGRVSGRTEVTLMSTLIAPKLVSSRDQARELTATLADDLSGTVVMVDCSALQASTPSFVDELVKAVLVDRRGSRLVIKGAPERTVELARRAAHNRGVGDRLETG
jgi:hypothetical protein